MDKANTAHFDDTGEFLTTVEKAATVLELIDARVDAGKDSSEVADLESAAVTLVQAQEALDEAVREFDEHYGVIEDAAAEIEREKSQDF